MPQLGKNLPAIWETWVRFLGWEDPLKKEKATLSAFCSGEFHGLYSSWDLKEADTTEWLSLSLYYRQAASRTLKILYLFILAVLHLLCHAKDSLVVARGLHCPVICGKWQPTPVFLPGESCGQRSLVGYRPRVAKSRTRLSDFTFTFMWDLSSLTRDQTCVLCIWRWILRYWSIKGVPLKVL